MGLVMRLRDLDAFTIAVKPGAMSRTAQDDGGEQLQFETTSGRHMSLVLGTHGFVTDLLMRSGGDVVERLTLRQTSWR